MIKQFSIKSDLSRYLHRISALLMKWIHQRTDEIWHYIRFGRENVKTR